MLDAFYDTFELLPRGLIYVALGILVVYFAKLIQDWITPYRIGDQVGTGKNNALGLSLSGYFVGVIIVFVAVLYTPFSSGGSNLTFDIDFATEVLQVFLYSMGGILVLNLTRYLIDHLVLRKFKVEKAIIEDQNIGTGAVEFGIYIAVALVIASSLAGEAAATSIVEEILRSVVFFLLGMVVLVAYTYFYQFTTRYDIHDEIERANPAVGITVAANLIAIAIVTFKAVYGVFMGWGESLVSFVTFAITGFILLLVVRWIVDKVIFPRIKIPAELSESQNTGVAFIVGGVVISASLVLYFAI
ncbi:MAG: DUF350 domain-containing protein [SAR202 cluster bacterium]|nr:DUF350 domain-containing protein [SAR202 cluster bacterium]